MQDERSLLSRIQAGDADAFGLWASASERALRLTLRPFSALVDTEAVLQEALLRVWHVAPRFVPDGKPNALLRFSVTTARNCAVSELRKSRPTREALDALERELASTSVVTAITPDPLLRAAIIECRNKLPPQPKLALEQRLHSGGTEDDTALATRVGMSLNTFLQNFTRARKLLRACLEKAGIDLDGELT
jgi:DNA-directed RNA polymerase specialized sigma24 family protein